MTHRTPKHFVRNLLRRVFCFAEALGVRTRPRVAFRRSPRFGVRSLLDLLETRIGVADPIACFVDLLWIYRNRSRNLLPPCYQLTLILHRFAAFDRKFPMTPEFIERVIYGLRFSRADAAATHGVVEHAVTIPRWPVVLPVGDIVQQGAIPIFSCERAAHDGPEIARDGCAIDNRADRGGPDDTIWICITQ